MSFYSKSVFWVFLNSEEFHNLFPYHLYYDDTLFDFNGHFIMHDIESREITFRVCYGKQCRFIDNIFYQTKNDKYEGSYIFSKFINIIFHDFYEKLVFIVKNNSSSDDILKEILVFVNQAFSSVKKHFDEFIEFTSKSYLVEVIKHRLDNFSFIDLVNLKFSSKVDNFKDDLDNALNRLFSDILGFNRRLQLKFDISTINSIINAMFRNLEESGEIDTINEFKKDYIPQRFELFELKKNSSKKEINASSFLSSYADYGDMLRYKNAE